jgi:NAD(P)H-hydrate epimerase
VVVVCGKGNNGGDGLVITRLLKQRRWPVKAYLVGALSDLKGDALANSRRCQRSGVKVTTLSEKTWKAFDADLGKAEVIVDAIFGTGFEGEPHGLAREAIDAINLSQACVVAVDIASGVNATSGEAQAAVRAHVTVTMGLAKRGHVLFPGRALTGRLVVGDIGIPDPVVAAAGLHVHVAEDADVQALIPDRPADSHKWSCGHVVCICGSVGLTGAATLASVSALRAGAGLVTLAIPRSLNAIMEVKLTEVMTLPVDETPQGSFSLGALDALRTLIGRADCVALGPGLSQNGETAELVRTLVATLDKPCVLDADGINAFAGRADCLKGLPYPLVLTPHAGEAARLFGVDKAEIIKRPIEFASERAKDLGLVLVLKGAPTITAGPDGGVFVNPTGNQGLSTAGSGDVLTGIISGLMAQGVQPMEAAYSAAYIHGYCADILLPGEGVRILAGDVARQIPHAIQGVLGRLPWSRAGRMVIWGRDASGGSARGGGQW